MSATGPMTILMEFLHRRLPWVERYALPPREITEELAEKAGVGHELQGENKAAVVLLNHFAYGGAAGALYAAVFGRSPRQGIVKGMGFGVVVWLVSYFGLLPAANMLKPAQEHPARRNALMLVVHLLWGALLGAFVEMVETENTASGGALVKDSAQSENREKGG